MLVLKRSIEQVINIGNDIEIKILNVRGRDVKVGITAPKNISVHRNEIYQQIKAKNQFKK